VLYLIFNEGYTASGGPQLGRVDLSAEAIRLTRILAGAAPAEPEASGLLALMLLTEARRPARTGAADELVPLAEQDRAHWDRGQLAEGTALIDEVWAAGPPGPYRIQAAIAAVHARAASFGETDWPQIVGLYLRLEQQTPTAPVRLGRVVAAAHAFGPGVGLQLLDDLDAAYGIAHDPLTEQRAHAVRAHLLEQRHDHSTAAVHFRAAAELTSNDVERDYLLARAAQADAR
jgi:predicted RNA polymerase sigma factor